MYRTGVTRCQFTIRELLLATTAISLMLAWLTWLIPRMGLWAIYPGPWGFVSLGILSYAWFVLWGHNGSSRAWTLIVLAWYIALANTASPMFAAGYTFVPPSDTDRQFAQKAVHYCLVSGITLPLFFTIPLVYVVLTRGKGRTSATVKWLLVSLAIPLLDIALLTVLLSTTLGTWRF